MAGTPFKKVVRERIRAKGGYSPVFERIASGETLTSIAKDYDCSRQFLRKLLTENEKLATIFHNSQRDAAHALVDDGMQILDDSPVDRDAINLAKARAEYRKWLAGMYDKETFGEKQAGPILNIGQLHLQALAAAPAMPNSKSLPSGNEHPVLDAVIEEAP